MKNLTASILCLSLVACVPSLSTPGPAAPSGGPSLAGTSRLQQDPGIVPLAFFGTLIVVGGVALFIHAMKDDDKL